MKHIIIGTAGHIDHGKTTLIKALTGRDTDTLKEEKDRGISINLGFTFFDLPSGKRAGIIDVPGHEKFIKNMLAGVSGIDIVLMVIAADEGIMPQTKEHMEILQLLNVKKGIIVLTKIDLVEEDWIMMVEEEIRVMFKGTFLLEAPIYSVSSKTGEGLSELVEAIDKATDEIEAKDTEGHFRLPVDRVFSINGFGTVVTGTVIGGTVAIGDNIEVYPAKLKAKVRSIQIHEQSVDIAEAGQRCALNLSNIKVEDIKRGDVLSGEGLMEPSMMVDCKLYYLKSAGRPLVNRQRIRLYHGTDEILGRVAILDKEEVKPGENAYIQLRLEEALTSQRNDRLVIRSYSPMNTIGGGIIIEPAASKAKAFDTKYLEALRVKESGKTESILENAIEKLSGSYPEIPEILKAIGRNDENIESKLEQLCNNKRVIKLVSLEKPSYVHVDYLKEKITQLEKILKSFHNEKPLKLGMSKEEIKNRVFGKNVKQKHYDELLEALVQRNVIRITNNFIALSCFTIKFTKDYTQIINSVLEAYKSAMYMPPKYEEVILKEKDKNRFKMIFEYLLDSGELIKLGEDSFFYKEYYENAKKLVKNYVTDHGSISAAETRDLLKTSRKHAVSLLEHFDTIKFTKRIEDKRILY
jgi:selenocysteine-specific elongation factor